MSHEVTKHFQDIESSIEFDFEAAKLDFALELKRLMDQKDIKKTHLAELLQVSKPMITKLLRGDANVTIETMVKASRVLDGKLLVRIVRENCNPRVFEIARSEASKANDAHAWCARITRSSNEFSDEWNRVASSGSPHFSKKKSTLSHEIKSIAA